MNLNLIFSKINNETHPTYQIPREECRDVCRYYVTSRLVQYSLFSFSLYSGTRVVGAAKVHSDSGLLEFWDSGV